MMDDLLVPRITAAAAAIAPGVLMLAYFSYARAWRGIRELMWIAFGLGFTAAIPISGIASAYPATFLDIADSRLYALTIAFLEASVPEELGKLLVLYYFIMRHEDLRRPLDVVPLAILVSLGFASIENVYYVFGSDDWSGTAMVRAVTAIPMHSTMGIVMGFYGARSLIPGQSQRSCIFQMWLWPTLLHGLYDYPVFAVQRLYEETRQLAESDALEFQIIFVLALLATVAVAAGAIRSLTVTAAFLRPLPLNVGAASSPPSESTVSSYPSTAYDPEEFRH